MYCMLHCLSQHAQQGVASTNCNAGTARHPPTSETDSCLLPRNGWYRRKQASGSSHGLPGGEQAGFSHQARTLEACRAGRRQRTRHAGSIGKSCMLLQVASGARSYVEQGRPGHWWHTHSQCKAHALTGGKAHRQRKACRREAGLHAGAQSFLGAGELGWSCAG